MPTSWYWYEVTGANVPLVVVLTLVNVDTGTGMRDPICRVAFSPSEIRICGLASNCVLPSDFSAVYDAFGIEKLIKPLLSRLRSESVPCVSATVPPAVPVAGASGSQGTGYVLP